MPQLCVGLQWQPHLAVFCFWVASLWAATTSRTDHRNSLAIHINYAEQLKGGFAREFWGRNNDPNAARLGHWGNIWSKRGDSEMLPWNILLCDWVKVFVSFLQTLWIFIFTSLLYVVITLCSLLACMCLLNLWTSYQRKTEELQQNQLSHFYFPYNLPAPLTAANLVLHQCR